jgi:hypothetical protein
VNVSAIVRGLAVGLGFAVAVAACTSDPDKPYNPPSQSGSGPATASTSVGDGSTGGDTTDTGDTDTDTGGVVPTDYNYAFVSSETYVAGEIGGTVEADLKCQALADAAGLDGNYVAWLSTATGDAKSKLAGARAWVRTDGRPFVDDVTDLINGRTLFPLGVDEWGQRLDDVTVVTATDPTGVRYSDADHGTCDDWTSTDPQLATTGGVSDTGDASWTQWDSLSIGCDAAVHLYCFGIDASEPLDFEPTQGRVAFVTAQPLLPSVGLEVADSLCAEEAGQGGLIGEFRAMMATDTATALGRFDLDGATWVRPDGVPIVEAAADLPDGILAPIARTADGVVAYPSLAWTGAPDPETASSLESCSSWTTLVGEARVGLSSRSTSGWFDSESLACDADYGVVYCFET